MEAAMDTATLAVGAEPAGRATHPVDRLMRDRPGLVADVTAGRDVASIARSMLVVIAAGGALFGAAIGSYRGGVQIAYAAIKLPLVLLLTAALSAPALTAFNIALDRPARLTRDLALALCALGLGALALAAQAPLVMVARALEIGYHQTTMLVVACCAVAGAASLVFLLRSLHLQAGFGAMTVASLLCAVAILVGGQLAWTFRPYLVRPRTVDVPFLRSTEGNLIEAVQDTMRSLQGDYRRSHAPLPGEDTPALPPCPPGACESELVEPGHEVPP
jgi:hypothetical protein